MRKRKERSSISVGVLLSLLPSIGGERTAPAYLLASDAALLHGYAMKQIAECFAGTPAEERVIGIHVGDNVYEALSFVCYYARNVQDEYLVIPERKDGMMILETRNGIRYARPTSWLHLTRWRLTRRRNAIRKWRFQMNGHSHVSLFPGSLSSISRI